MRTVFRLYLEGYSAAKISEYLQEKGIRTTTGKEKWHATVVMKMLRNEKYMGDALLQDRRGDQCPERRTGGGREKEKAG